ncbi:hypothetical protein BDR22DRAFT_917809 [Usnea florida]
MKKHSQENYSPWETDQERASRQGTTEKAQMKTTTQLSTKHAAQHHSPATISSTLATRTRASILDKESFPPLPPATSSTAPRPVLQDNRQPPKSNPNPPLPPPPTKAQTLAILSSELQRRQHTRSKIERQLDACLQELSTHPSKQPDIENQRSKRLSELLNPEPNSKPQNANAKPPKTAMTAEETEAQELRDRQLEYESGAVAPPDGKTVEAFFDIIADAERQLIKADEANRGAREREGKLDEELYRAHCAIFEMEDEIEVVRMGMEGGGAREG